MTKKEIEENLCVYDKRSPYDMLAVYEAIGDETPMPRKDCGCDNCFYGRDQLAVELLKTK